MSDITDNTNSPKNNNSVIDITMLMDKTTGYDLLSLMPRDHEAHILRRHLDEWCGGTEPPTIVMVNHADAELYVDIFEGGTDLHDGNIHQPVGREQFLLPQKVKLGPGEIGSYACRALGETAS